MLNADFNDDKDVAKLTQTLDLMLNLEQKAESPRLTRRTSKSQPSLNGDDLLSSPQRMLLMSPRKNQMIEFVQDFEQAVFLFADIKDFSILSQQIPSRTLVDLLNTIYSAFQDIVELQGAALGINIVKLEGDCIMLAAAGSSSEEIQNQVNAMIYIGHLFSNFMFAHNKQKSDHQFDFRFGINIGKATKTLTKIKEPNGQVRQQTDWFGEAVNKASRMESSSHPNQVQVTDDVYQITKKHFDFSSQTIRVIKGYGEVATRFILKPSCAFLKEHGETASLRTSGGSSSTELPRKMSSPRSNSANK